MKQFSQRIIIFVMSLTGLLFADLSERHHSISQKNLLSSALGQWSQGQFEFRDRMNQTRSEIDTLRIAGIRVEFQKDNDINTTGSGQFDLTVPDVPTTDPAPHDAAYFEQQLLALSNYYAHVSGGRCVLQTEVLPQVFTLSDSMAVYNPATTDDATDQGLARLFHESITLADGAGFDLSVFHSILVFHAGVGKDIDLGYDPTPNDIPSAFLNITDLKTEFGEDYAGIPLNNGSFVTEGIILPETESQLDYEVGLLGTAALMFGFQLGLPALWHTEYGQTGIGRWGLMDQGSGNYNGLIPAEPCAWSKVYLGWEDPVVVTQGENLPVACVSVQAEPKIYKIPINDDEYFLIENRQYDANGDSLAKGQTASGGNVIFRPDGSIELSETGVIVSVDDYDFGLPGSGILIWHIDEAVIRDRMNENGINNDRDYRGVDLEEADGAQDLGYSYGFISGGAGSENGVLHDAWFKDNEIHQKVNESDVVQLTPYTYPDSRSNAGANSHIRIHLFSKSDTVMTFSVSNDLVMPGYPVDVGQGEALFSPTHGDLDGDGLDEIVVISQSGRLFAWHADKTFIVSPGQGRRQSINGSESFFEVPLLAEIASVEVPLVLGDLNEDGSDEIYAAAGSQISGWRVQGDAVENHLSVNTVSPVTEMLVSTRGLIAGTAAGNVRMIQSNGEQSDLCQLGGSVTGLALSASANNAVVVTGGNALVIVTFDGEILSEVNAFEIKRPVSGTIETGAPSIIGVSQDILLLNPESHLVSLRSITTTDVALGDVNQDGFKDVLYTDQGKIWGLQANGSLVDNFPKPIYQRNLELSMPLIADVDGDGASEVVAATSAGTIEAYNQQGLMADGFPVSTGCVQPITPLIVDLDQDGDVELLAVTDDGLCFGWDLAGKTEGLIWGSEKRNPQRTALNSDLLETDIPQQDWMPENQVYNYPNPTEGNATTIRYRLESDAEVKIKIYDLSGRLVYETDAPGGGMIDHDVPWDISDVESGVYFCQVRASRQGEEKVVTIKIAVVK